MMWALPCVLTVGQLDAHTHTTRRPSLLVTAGAAVVPTTKDSRGLYTFATTAGTNYTLSPS